MPMSPRLLRPRASAALVAVDPDARTYINAVRIADGGQYMEPAVQLAIDAFVIGCKADGIWSAIKASCILMGARTLSGALTPLVGAAPTNNGPFVSGDYNRKTGLVGDGVGKYLDTGRAANADPQNDHHFGVYVSAARTTGLWFMGVGFSDGVGAGQTAAQRSRNVLSNDTTGASITPYTGVSRTASTAWTYRYSGTTSTGPTTASATSASANYFVFARNQAGSFSYTNARIAFYSLGESLTLATLDTRVSALYTAIGAAI